MCPREQAFHSGISRTIGISNEFSVRDEASKITILKVPHFGPPSADVRQRTVANTVRPVPDVVITV